MFSHRHFSFVVCTRVIIRFTVSSIRSSLGFLVAPPAVDYVRSYVSRIEQIDWDYLNALFANMEADAEKMLVEAGANPDEISYQRTSDMRHVGQGFEVSVPVQSGTLNESQTHSLRTNFLNTYEMLFERAVTDVPIEAMSWRVAAFAPVPNIALNFKAQSRVEGEKLKGRREVYFFETGFAPCDVYNRYALVEGDIIAGPAIIEERESTTVMPPGTQAAVDSSLNLIIELNA